MKDLPNVLPKGRVTLPQNNIRVEVEVFSTANTSVLTLKYKALGQDFGFETENRDLVKMKFLVVVQTYPQLSEHILCNVHYYWSNIIPKVSVLLLQ